MNAPPKMPALVDAINDMRVISFMYHGKRRIVQPQCHGIATSGKESLRGYEPARVGTKEPLYTVAEMSELIVTDQHFSEPGPHYTPNDSVMVFIFAQLKPGKKS
jgi:hypothetical protein